MGFCIWERPGVSLRCVLILKVVEWKGNLTCTDANCWKLVYGFSSWRWSNSHLLLLSHLIYLRTWLMVSHQIDGLSALDVVFPEENSLNTKPCTMTLPNSNLCLEIQGGSLMAVISLQYSKAYCPFWDLVIARSDDWFVALPFGVLGSFVLLWVYCTEQHTKVVVSWEGHMDVGSLSPQIRVDRLMTENLVYLKKNHGNPMKKWFYFTFHPSLVVYWWLLVHFSNKLG